MQAGKTTPPPSPPISAPIVQDTFVLCLCSLWSTLGAIDRGPPCHKTNAPGNQTTPLPEHARGSKNGLRNRCARRPPTAGRRKREREMRSGEEKRREEKRRAPRQNGKHSRNGTTRAWSPAATVSRQQVSFPPAASLRGFSRRAARLAPRSKIRRRHAPKRAFVSASRLVLPALFTVSRCRFGWGFTGRAGDRTIPAANGSSRCGVSTSLLPPHLPPYLLTYP